MVLPRPSIVNLSGATIRGRVPRPRMMANGVDSTAQWSGGQSSSRFGMDHTRALWTPSFSPWLIAVVVAMAAFMEILDMSIANVALPYMAGSFGATNDESTWILTSYLVSNAIVLPISAWFVAFFGRKRFFLICLVIFTLSSVLCGFAPSLPAMILFRVLQGAGGGGLQPMAQAILADSFPPKKRGLAFAVFGITAVVAPTIGPTLGGWITDSYSWRWIFFINVPVGILTLMMVNRVVEDPPYFKARMDAGVKMDYVGVALLVLGVSALQIMLDKGQEDNWFASHFILTLAVVAGVCLVALVIWDWHYKHPIIEMRLFRNFNYLSCNLMIFIVGVVLFSSLVMLPQYMETLMGYTAQTAGMVLSTAALVSLVELPVVGKLTTHVQARYLAAFGWMVIAASMFYTTQTLQLGMSFRFAQTLRVFQSFGLPFLFVPITLIAYVGLPQDRSNAISGMLNFMRNIGSSVGTSLVTTSIARRAQVHQLYLGEHVYHNPTGLDRAIAGLAARLSIAGLNSSRALMRSYALLYRAVIGQAMTLAFIDTFLLLAVAASIMFVVTFFLRKNDPHGQESDRRDALTRGRHLPQPRVVSQFRLRGGS